MGLFDSLGGGGGKKELEDLRKEVGFLKSRAVKAEAERDEFQKKNVLLIDKTHAFLERLKLLVGTLDNEFVVQRTWDLVDMALAIKKGAVYARTPDGWVPEFAVGFGKDGQAPVIPLKEESVATFAAEQGVIISLAHLRKQDDLAYLERRGIIPDVKIACPVRVEGEIQRLLLVCQYGGNVFAGEDDLDLLNMVAMLLGLVMTNTLIIERQKAAYSQQSEALSRLRRMFSQMVAPEVIQYIERNPGGIVLGGTRQRVAVLFADIRGFTQMSERNSPEKVIELLNRYFSRVTEIVINHRGTLDKFMGDAAMVLFGTPVPIDNPVGRSVQTAIDIQNMVQDTMADWVAGGFPAFSVGIGINFQEVVVGNVGSQKLSNFTAIGDGVNLAFRLCGLAKGGEIVVTQSCMDHLPDWEGQVEPRSGVMVKGKSEPQTVYVISQKIEFEEGPCPKCANLLPEGIKFCGKCGYRRY